MKITFVTSGLGTGGAEFALLRMCRAFGRRGARPSVVSLLDEGEVGPMLREIGVPVLALRLREPLAWARANHEFDRFCAVRQPQVVQGWMYHGNLAALHLARRGTPVVWGIRQSLLGNRDKAHTRFVIRTCALLSSRASCIVYNSASARRQHEALGFASARAMVIPNGLDLDEFRFDEEARQSIRSESGFGANQVVVGHVARFHPSKNHAGFLRAIARIAPSHPNLRVALAGAGIDADNQALRSLLSALALENHVTLLGRRTDVASLMSAFDIVCSSSTGMEGFPNVVAEAMSCGVPCVVTDVGDAPLVVGCSGRIVPPENEAALAAALHDLVGMTQEQRRTIGMQARSHIADHFAIDSVAGQYLRLYESLATLQAGSPCAA